MSVMFLPAVAFLVAVLVVAEFVWLREAAEERARSLMSDDIRPSMKPRLHWAAYSPRTAANCPTKPARSCRIASKAEARRGIPRPSCSRPGRPGLMKPILLCQRPHTKARLDYLFTIRRRFLDRFRH